jgi:hypothetical protein
MQSDGLLTLPVFVASCFSIMSLTSADISSADIEGSPNHDADELIPPRTFSIFSGVT